MSPPRPDRVTAPAWPRRSPGRTRPIFPAWRRGRAAVPYALPTPPPT